MATRAKYRKVFKSHLLLNHWRKFKIFSHTVKPMQKRPFSKRSKIGFQGQLSLNAGKNDCRILEVEHSAILSTFIKLPIVIKIFVLSIFEWPFYTRFTVGVTLNASYNAHNDKMIDNVIFTPCFTKVHYTHHILMESSNWIGIVHYTIE